MPEVLWLAMSNHIGHFLPIELWHNRGISLLRACTGTIFFEH